MPMGHYERLLSSTLVGSGVYKFQTNAMKVGSTQLRTCRSKFCVLSTLDMVFANITIIPLMALERKCVGS